VRVTGKVVACGAFNRLDNFRGRFESKRLGIADVQVSNPPALSLERFRGINNVPNRVMEIGCTF
jgi:hypothetical protein